MDNLNFKKVTHGELQTIADFVSHYEPYSDFNPMSLVYWNSKRLNMYAISQNVLVIKIVDYLKDVMIHSFLGTTVGEDLFSKLLACPEELKMVPEITLAGLSNDVEFAEDRDGFDYVINLNDFANMQGGKYKPLRKRLNNFVKKNPGCKVQLLDLDVPGTQKLVFTLTEVWSKNKGFDRSKTSEDLDSVEEYIKASYHFDCVNTGLFIKDKFVGFSFSQLLPNGWSMGHLGKADVAYEDSSLFLEHESDNILRQRGAKYINLQQDTGLQGLRQSKLSYRPARFLRKYIINKSA